MCYRGASRPLDPETRIRGDEVRIALENMPTRYIVIGKGDDILAARSRCTRLNQATFAVIEGSRDRGCVVIEAIKLINLLAGCLRRGATTPVGIVPLLGEQPTALTRQGLTCHASEEVVVDARGLAIGVGCADRPGAIAKECRCVRITGAGTLVECIGGTCLEDIEGAIVTCTTAILCTSNGTACMPGDACIGIGVSAANGIPIRIIGRCGGRCAAGRIAIGRGSTIGIACFAGGLPSRQIAGLTSNIVLSIIAGVTTSQTIARAILCIAKGRCINDIGACRACPGCCDPIVPDIGCVLDDLARCSPIAGGRLFRYTPITIVDGYGGRGDATARSILNLIDALRLLHITDGGGIVVVQFAHQIAIPGVGLALIYTGRRGCDSGWWTDRFIGIVRLLEQRRAIRIIVQSLILTTMRGVIEIPPRRGMTGMWRKAGDLAGIIDANTLRGIIFMYLSAPLGNATVDCANPINLLL